MQDVPLTKQELSDLGKAAKEAGRFNEAIAYCERILELEPADSQTIANMAGVYAQVGDWENALALFKKARDIAPHITRHHDDYLYFLHHSPVAPEDHFEEHLKYGDLFAIKETVYPHRKIERQKIRLGYLSTDLHEHATYFLLEPILEAHDKKQFEIYLYSTSDLHDRHTDTLASYAHTFRELHGISHEKIREIILADEIDILVDLGGHTGENNLAVFAMRAAPIQVSWFSYMNTSGLDTMDYRLTDLWRTPLERAPFYTEKLVHLPNSYTFRPPYELLPPFTSLPAHENGYVTFGSFNTSHKLNREVVDLWCEILHILPDSRLSLMVPNGTQYLEWILGQFSLRGISTDRIIPRQIASLPTFFGYIGATDIALDPFPYTGGATTYHALSMGVPTVTLEGRGEYERNCAAIMREVGLPDWIARTREEYLSIAIQKVLAQEELSQLRQTLRARVGANAETVVRSIENAFLKMVNDYNTPELSLSKRAPVTHLLIK